MGERAEALAQRFEAANHAMIAAVEQCSDEQWRQVCAGEGWPVGVTAHHVARSQSGITGLVQAIANGQPVSVTQAWIDERNAQWARDFVGATREEALDVLRSSGVAAASAVRGLSDEQLGRTATVLGNEMSAQQVIEGILIGHPKGHLESMRAAMGAA